MNKQPVVLIGFGEFDNLGIGYLASVLNENGYQSEIIDFSRGKKQILAKLLKLKPKIAGFCVIYENYLNEFAKLIGFLRSSGINCHFTAGGHYASLRYKEIFEFIPSLTSVARFEGEYTFLELVNSVYSGRDWRKISGLAYKDDGRIISNCLRPLEIDLDKFPYPVRTLPLKEYALKKKYATILAGRGCIYDCSFCSTHEFYKQSSGPVKRIRRPEMVVQEMEFLYRKQNCSVFLFQDDDFPVKPSSELGWIDKFCLSLRQYKLEDKIMWKINCRPDEIDSDRFIMMKEHGLFLIFLGIEDGSDSGLKRLNKHMTISKSIEGVNILKNIEIGFDYGFMLFQPSTTFKSLKENLCFLRKICSDGYTPLTFLKIMPYYETRIEKELSVEGRLKGKPGFLDYDFYDELLNNYYNYVMNIFLGWLRSSDGLSNISKWARNYLSVFSHFYEMTPEVRTISSDVRKFTSQSNIFILDTMEELAYKFETGKYDDTQSGELKVYRENVKEKHDQFKKQIIKLVKEIERIVEYQRIVQLVGY
jgi:radical SAM superfamily enzyme YgiQ (UPF0313 family)